MLQILDTIELESGRKLRMAKLEESASLGAGHGPHVNPDTAQLPVCQTAPERHIQCLVDAGETAIYAPGETIAAAGSPGTALYVVLEGQARVVLGPAGNEPGHRTTIKLVGTGGLYGLISVLDGQPHYTNLQAVTETRVVAVHREGFVEELQKHPETALSLLGQLAEMVRASAKSLLHQV